MNSARRVDLYEVVNQTRLGSLIVIGDARGAEGLELVRGLKELPSGWDAQGDELVVEDLAQGLEEGDAEEFARRYSEAVARPDWQVSVLRY